MCKKVLCHSCEYEMEIKLDASTHIIVECAAFGTVSPKTSCKKYRGDATVQKEI